MALPPTLSYERGNAGKDRNGLEVVLIRVTESGQQQPVALGREKTIIGRMDDCHIRIPMAGVSRKHCEIIVAGGSVTVNDLGSSNGTYVNQDRIESMPVSAGDLLSVGGLVFVVTVNGQPGDIDPEIMYEDGLPDESEASVAARPQAPAPAANSEPAPKAVPASMLSEDSSMMDFDFDFDDDEDDQPPL
jgi:pSer/pThr/pTyr-binding forkhead associated (FHA) protein